MRKYELDPDQFTVEPVLILLGDTLIRVTRARRGVGVQVGTRVDLGVLQTGRDREPESNGLVRTNCPAFAASNDSGP